jgi:flagellar motor component MotA
MLTEEMKKIIETEIDGILHYRPDVFNGIPCMLTDKNGVWIRDYEVQKKFIKLFSLKLEEARKETLANLEKEIIDYWGEWGDPVVKTDLIPFMRSRLELLTHSNERKNV